MGGSCLELSEASVSRVVVQLKADPCQKNPSAVFHVRIQRWGQGIWTTPENKAIVFLNKNGPYPLKNHKVTKPTFI